MGIFVAVWRLNRDIDVKNAALGSELKKEIADLRTEQKADNTDLRSEFKRVENKVDDGNQRLARLEGVILSREGLVEAIINPDPSA